MKIFVASSGRCGTGFLYSGFKRFTNINAFHEQAPVIMGDLLKEANSMQESEALRAKAVAIKSSPFYVDTAHQFMRGFYRYALEEIPSLRVIKLARDPLVVARSRINRDVIPGKTPWLGSFDDELNHLRLDETEWNSLTDFQRVLWDWLEHEERFDQVKDRFVQTVYVTFEALTLNTADTFKRIFTELGFRHFNIDTIHLYTNANLKPSVVLPGDQEEFDDLVVLLKSKGHSLKWLDTPYYRRVIKRHNVYQREVNLLKHYDSHPNYSSIDPAWGIDKFPISLGTNTRVLDLGCGDGRWSRRLKERFGCHVVGVDFSSARIAKARELAPGIPFHCENAYDFVENYNGPMFDYVLMVETLEHLKRPEVLLKGLQRITKNIFGTVSRNYPYVAHLQVYKTAKQFRERFPEWDIKTALGKVSPESKKKTSIYFWTK